MNQHIYIVVRLSLSDKVRWDDQAREIVEGLDYSVTHDKIVETEIVDLSPDKPWVYGFSHRPPKEPCLSSFENDSSCERFTDKELQILLDHFGELEPIVYEIEKRNKAKANLKFEVIKHPVERYLFKARVWVNHASALDLTSWVPKVDANRAVEDYKKELSNHDWVTMKRILEGRY